LTNAAHRLRTDRLDFRIIEKLLNLFAEVAAFDNSAEEPTELLCLRFELSADDPVGDVLPSPPERPRDVLKSSMFGSESADLDCSVARALRIEGQRPLAATESLPPRSANE
jgi:hypothetical protein